MPLTTNIRDLGAMPERRAGLPVDDEISLGLQAGLQLEGTEGTDFPEGRLDARRWALRDRARSRGLKMVSRSEVAEDGRVVLFVQWYREQQGDLRVPEQSDLRVPEQPRRRRWGLGRRG